jgi:hypothetical protein
MQLQKIDQTIYVKALLILLLVACQNGAWGGNLFKTPDGFLAPTADAIPPGFTLFLHASKPDMYACQFDRWVPQRPSLNKTVNLGNGVSATTGVIDPSGRARDAQLLISEWVESPKNTFDDRTKNMDNCMMSLKIRDFIFEGSPGVIYKTSNRYLPERETFDLLWKDNDRVLLITNVFEQKEPEYSSDALIAMLGKFRRH